MTSLAAPRRFSRWLSGLGTEDVLYQVVEPAWWSCVVWGVPALLLGWAFLAVRLQSGLLLLGLAFTVFCWLMGAARYRGRVALGPERLIAPSLFRKAEYADITRLDSTDAGVLIEHAPTVGPFKFKPMSFRLRPVDPETFLAELLDRIAADQGAEFAAKLRFS